MSNEVTTRMISAYNQMGPVLMFFTGLFQSPPENFHTSEEIEIDIERSDEDVSIVITDLSTGYRMNATDIYTNKKLKPPIHKEAIPINAHTLIKRQPGQNPFESPDFRANVLTIMFKGMVKIEKKIRRSIEWQASQVLQTGTVTMVDSNGAALYTIDYKPKATHFPTAGTAWGQVGDDPLGDISALAEVNRNDGLEDSDQLIFGIDAFEAFMKNADVIQRFETRRADMGTVSPMQMRGNGGNFRGTIDIGNYKYDMWTYGGRFKHPDTGVKTQFMDPSKVIVRSSQGRLDATFGAIPNIGLMLGAQANALLPELPSRLPNTEGSMDFFANAWLSPDGEQLFGGVGSRPLLIPTAIDTYGCLETNA